VPYSLWKEAFRDFLHPAGTMLFSTIRNETIFENTISVGLDVDVEVPDIPRGDNDETLAVSNDTTVFAQSYFKHAFAADLNAYEPYVIEPDGPYVVNAGTLNEITDTEGANSTTETFDITTQGFE